jgi:hypothetical protein
MTSLWIVGAGSIWTTRFSRDSARLVIFRCRSYTDLINYYQAMYLKAPVGEAEPTVVQSPSPASGLYIRTRGGDLTKVTIPVDCLAFQTGEALELATAGKLRATPHCVRVGAAPDASTISRETFALFMQPNVDQQLSTSENFGQFSKRIFDEHYGEATM